MERVQASAKKKVSALLLVTLRATGTPFHQDPQRSLAEFASELPTCTIEDSIYPHLLPIGQEC